MSQEVHGTDLFRFLFKHADKLFSDDLALTLGLTFSGQFKQETAFGIYTDEIHCPFYKGLRHLIALI